VACLRIGWAGRTLAFGSTGQFAGGGGPTDTDSAAIIGCDELRCLGAALRWMILAPFAIQPCDGMRWICVYLRYLR